PAADTETEGDSVPGKRLRLGPIFEPYQLLFLLGELGVNRLNCLNDSFQLLNLSVHGYEDCCFPGWIARPIGSAATGIFISDRRSKDDVVFEPDDLFLRLVIQRKLALDVSERS